jgi:hypothetical protein
LISTRIFNPEIDSIRLKIYWALIFLSGWFFSVHTFKRQCSLYSYVWLRRCWQFLFDSYWKDIYRRISRTLSWSNQASW